MVSGLASSGYNWTARYSWVTYLISQTESQRGADSPFFIGRPLLMRICSIEGCDRKLYARKMCSAHYRRVNRTGTPGSPEIRVANRTPPSVCRVEGCKRSYSAKNYCRPHYLQSLRFGDRSFTLPPYCEVCGATEKLNFDHDHSCCDVRSNTKGCGECLRGRLCNGCNTALGLVLESPSRLRKLAEYAEDRCGR